jgi:hypothetical protein
LIDTPNWFSFMVAVLAGVVGVVSITEARSSTLIECQGGRTPGRTRMAGGSSRLSRQGRRDQRAGMFLATG